MRIVKLEQLKSRNDFDAPFYCVMKDDGTDRAFGCANLAMINLQMLLRRVVGANDNKTAFDILNETQKHLPENDEQAVRFQIVMEFLESQEIFDNSRILVMNPSGMVPEIFLEIALRRLLQGNIALVMCEIPQKGEPPTAKANHLAVLHSNNGDVFLDSLKIDLSTFIRLLYFSPINTLMFFEKKGGKVKPEHYYLGPYERMCLEQTVAEIKKAYPHLSKNQIEKDIKLMKAMDTEWERAKLRRFLRSIGFLIYGFNIKNPPARDDKTEAKKFL